MLRHISRSLKLPNGRRACEIETEAEAEQIAADLVTEADAIEAQVIAHKAQQVLGERVDLEWLHRARRAAHHRRDTARSIKGALKVMRREEHQRREALRLAAGIETPEQKRERIELVSRQQETDCARFVAEVRSRIPREEYLEIWETVRAGTGEELLDPDIGSEAVGHLRTMYPGALDTAPKSAATSLRNFINGRVSEAVARARDAGIKL